MMRVMASIDPSADRVDVAPGIALPQAALGWSFARGGGPGGQNVNKVATKATLTVTLADLAEHLPADAVTRLKAQAGSAVVGEGGGAAVQVSSAASRSQWANRKHCLEKLRELLVHAMRKPKRRRPTRPSRRSIQRRLDAKKRRGEIKRTRKNPRKE